MTYQSYLDGHILVSQELINDLPVILPVLIQDTLILLLSVLLFIWIWQRFVSDYDYIRVKVPKPHYREIAGFGKYMRLHLHK